MIAVQWEPTGGSNGAIPLSCSVDNSDQPVTTKRQPDPRTKPSIDDQEEHLTGHVFNNVLVELLVCHNQSLILENVIALNKINE